LQRCRDRLALDDCSSHRGAAFQRPVDGACDPFSWLAGPRLSHLPMAQVARTGHTCIEPAAALLATCQTTPGITSPHDKNRAGIGKDHSWVVLCADADYATCGMGNGISEPVWSTNGDLRPCRVATYRLARWPGGRR